MIIYALIDPRDNAIRYVGKTFRTAHRRLRRHLASCYLNGKTHKERWLRTLVALGVQPIITVIETCTSSADLSKRERFWIAHYRAVGAALTNATDGGDGVGYKHTPESKERIRVALIGRSFSREHRLRIGLASRGRIVSADTKAKLSASSRQRTPPVLRGSLNGRSKLSESDVATLRALRGHVSQSALATVFGVSKTAVRLAQQCKNWRHLTCQTHGASMPESFIREFPQPA